MKSHAQTMVDAQAEDAGLWFIAQTAAEAYLQHELRRLHAAVEHDTKASAPAGRMPTGDTLARDILPLLQRWDTDENYSCVDVADAILDLLGRK